MHFIQEKLEPCEVLIVGSSRCNSGPTTHSSLLHINHYGYDSCLYMSSALMTFKLSIAIVLLFILPFWILIIRIPL